jgi:tetratricopeptide (TPR) repeat protein
MRRWMIAPSLLLLTSAAPPPPAPFDLSRFMQVCGGGPGDGPVAEKTVILPGYGPGGFAIRTAKPEAQAFFDNGIQLAHGFAHQATVAAFVEARRIDPSCAMCAWGEAYSKGPTINYDIGSGDGARLAGIVTEARKLAKDGPEIELQLIDALAKRYPGSGVDNQAYAAAMDALATANPGSDPIAVLAAEALMIAAPSYTAENMKRPVALLETVLARSPDYAPAIHFYIHATEGAGYAERALPYADRLAAIAPAASHLVHMPAHTFYWAGRYADAGTTNLRAVQINDADAVRMGKTEPGASFNIPNYQWHNAVFGIGGALLAGDSATGTELARAVLVALGARDGMYIDTAAGKAYVALARLGSPDALFALPDPGPARPVAQVMWHYARGEAYARQGNREGLKAEVKALRKHVRSDAEKFRQIAALVLEGRLAVMDGKPARALSFLRLAATLEEAPPFGTSYDPPIWWFPVRRSYAAALLQSGDAKGALAETDTVLKRRKGDPMTLAIRAAALAALGRAEESARDLAAARKGWRGDPALLAAPFA